MTQDAVVLNSFPDGTAEVAVTRGTACGSNCGNCESCIYQNELHAKALNPLAAKRGQKVIIQSKSAAVYKAEMIVYVMPMLMLIIGYLVADLLGAADWVCILAGFLSLILGVAVVVFTQRNKPEFQFEIVRIEND